MVGGAFFLAAPKATEVSIFHATTGVNGQGFQSWYKPSGVSMVEIIAVGGGAGGGGGINGTGGGGGGCSGITRFICPAIFLPDILYVQVGGGGPGGAAAGNGKAGILSYVLTSKTAVLPNIVCYSGAIAADPGLNNGSAGAASTVAVTQPINAVGEWFAIAGLIGTTGGAGANAGTSDFNVWGSLPLSGGAGGGGSNGGIGQNGGQLQLANNSGFDIGSQGYYLAADNIILNGKTSGGLNGGSGINRVTPFFCCGGTGGVGASTGVAAGKGGGGGYGCGGGGGGAGDGVNGAPGGNGGDGIVFIISW